MVELVFNRIFFNYLKIEMKKNYFKVLCFLNIFFLCFLVVSKFYVYDCYL